MIHNNIFKLFLILPFILYSYLSFSQETCSYFNLNDTIVKKGDIYFTTKIKFAPFYECAFDTNHITDIQTELKRIADFLLEHSNIKVEIGVFMGIKIDPNYSYTFECLPDLLIKELIKLGVEENRILGVNYKDDAPIVDFELIAYLSEREQKCAYSINKRIEVKILDL